VNRSHEAKGDNSETLALPSRHPLQDNQNHETSRSIYINVVLTHGYYQIYQIPANSSMAIELFTLTGGLYTQRVIIYLSEKHIINSPSLTITTCTQNGLKMEAPGKPPGTIPILSLGNGKHIKQSLAILEYFEDICDEAEKSGNKTELFEHAGSSMRGKTPEERARIREIVVLADEATSHFAVAAHKVLPSPLSPPL
jgi:hypothetical protein